MTNQEARKKIEELEVHVQLNHENIDLLNAKMANFVQHFNAVITQVTKRIIAYENGEIPQAERRSGNIIIP